MMTITNTKLKYLFMKNNLNQLKYEFRMQLLVSLLKMSLLCSSPFPTSL
jgi:hypothetical protein